MEAIRNMYKNIGVENFYREYGDTYENPHKEIINNLLKGIDVGENILDLCCGSGEVSKNFLNKNILGCDPFTYNLYKKNTNKECLTYDFKDIAIGKLSSYKFDTIICSFALHLCKESMLNTVLFQLACISERLIIITPHKRPDIKNYWKLESETINQKVRLRIYRRNL